MAAQSQGKGVPRMKRLGMTLTALLLALFTLLGTLPPVQAAVTETYVARELLAPVNPNASQEAKNLLAYLSMLKDTNTFVSGAFEMYTNTDLHDQVKEQFGVELGLYSCRYEETVNPGYTADNHDAVQITNETQASAVLKERYDRGEILLLHFDGALLEWLKDYAKTTYGTEDDMIVHLDATNPERDMTMYLAAETYQQKLEGVLGRLEDSGVKAYLYRPFVEFTNHKFNGVSDDGKEAFKRVSQQYSDRMKQSGLTGFLLNYTPSGGYYSEERYAGNAYYDVLGATMYSDSGFDGALVPRLQFTDYDWMSKTGKPFGFTELSCRTGYWQKQAADGRSSWYKTLTTMLQYWPEVTYVNTWGPTTYSLLTENRSGSEMAGNDDGSWFLSSPYTINREDLPDYRNGTIPFPGVAQVYATPNYGGNAGKTVPSQNFLALEEGLYTEAQLKTLGFDPAQLQSFHVGNGYGLVMYTGADGTGDRYSYIDGSAYAGNLPAFGKIRSLQVVRPGNILLDVAEIYASDNDDQAWKANDGENSRWTGQVGADGAGWLMADMGKPYTVNRWAVRHAGYAGEAEQYNTRDFRLQYSLDGENWLDADAVTDNTDPYTSRRLSRSVTGRYFRLLITNPNSLTAGEDQGRMTVAEFELYGVEAVLSAAQQPDGEEPEPDTGIDEEPGEDDGILDPADADTSDDADGDNNDTPTPAKRRRVVRQTVTSYLPWWAWVLIAAGAVAVGGGVLWIVLAARRRKRQPPTAG